MAMQILMPQLSPTMEEGRLAKWHVKEGDAVRSGDLVAEVETDKATMEIEAAEDGVIEKLLLAEGTEHVPVNHPIALLRVEDEVASPCRNARPSPSPKRRHRAPAGRRAPPAGEAPIAASPVMTARRKRCCTRSPSRSGKRPGRGGDGGAASSPRRSRGARARVRARAWQACRLRPAAASSRPISNAPRATQCGSPSPSRRRGPSRNQWSRPRAARARKSSSRGATGPSRSECPIAQVLALYRPGSYEIIPHDTMRKIIAERLTLSKQTIPHFYLAIDCDLDALLAARARLNALAPQRRTPGLQALGQRLHHQGHGHGAAGGSAANASWTEQGILRHRASDIAVAVALEGGGLHTPVIRDAEIKSLSEISNEMRDLAARARSKRLAPHEYQGGSTTISNLGMYGIDRFDAVINPPQASILAVGRGEKRAVVKDDALKIATMMSVTLSVDHRVIDGALGAELLAAFKAHIEDPVTMLV